MEYVFEHARMEQNEKMRVLVQLKRSIQSITSLVIQERLIHHQTINTKPSICMKHETR